VDRWNRKLVLVLSDSTAGLATLVVLILYLTGGLQIWHLYLIGFLAGIFQTFQYPAYAAAVTMMVPKVHYARASGMLDLAWSASSVLAPLLAGLLLGQIGTAGIMVIDLATFSFAIVSLLLAPIPQPAQSRPGAEAKGSIWEESSYGFRYIWMRPSLLALLLLFAAGNLAESAGFTLFAPMILARTGGSELSLGSVQSVGAIGGVVGGVLLSVWGGSKRRIHGVLTGWALSGAGILLMGIGRGLFVWMLASFLYAFFELIARGSNQAIWQVKVAPDIQGRVLGSRFLASQITMPGAMMLVGPLADHVFEPAMMPGGALAGALGWLVGPGPGAGMALLCVCAGLLTIGVPLIGYAVPLVRDVEDMIPDHDSFSQEVLS
jgi:MFS family permease